MGLVGNMDLTDHMMLRSYGKGHSMFLDRKTPHDLAENIVNELEVVTPSIRTPVRKLSGGNVQKVLVGREIGEDLDVLLALSDRIMVLCGGKVSGIVDARRTTKEQLGLLMTRMPEKVEIFDDIIKEEEQNA